MAASTSFVSYQLSKFADTRISSFGLKKKLSQCHFLRSEEGRHLGKKGKCIFREENGGTKVTNVTSPPSLISNHVTRYITYPPHDSYQAPVVRKFCEEKNKGPWGRVT